MKCTTLASLILACATVMTNSCNSSNSGSNGKEPIIGRHAVEIPDGRLTPEILWSMGRIGDYAVSANGDKIAYQVTYYSVEANKSHTILYVMNSDGSGQKQLTTTAYNESSPAWLKDGRIVFLSNKSGSVQIWSMKPDGSARRQLSHLDKDVEGFKVSPDENSILLVMSVPNPTLKARPHDDLPQASGMIADDLMFRHWDSWVENIPHPFIAGFKGGKVASELTDILQGEPYESPMLPFGGVEQLAWSADSKSVAYTCRKKVGTEYAKSTDSDIYIYSLESGKTVNLCKMEGESDLNLGYDTNPQFSPDGTRVAWQSMERDGYESDRNRLYVMELATGKKWSVTESFDSNVENFLWSLSGDYLFFVGEWQGRRSIFRATLDGKVVTILAKDCDYGSLSWVESNLLATCQSFGTPMDLVRIDFKRGMSATLTRENAHIMKNLDRVEIKERIVETTDGQSMLTWVVYPPNFDPEKKYPTLLFCEGGPQSMVSQFWSYRWNLSLMAHQGYVVVAPNRRGLPGFGSAWNEQISGDYGGQCMTDLLSAIDDVAKEPYVDRDRLGCVGASFGGYSVYWLAGHHEGRFKAFIAHDGIFNLEQQYLETEELWFTDWDLGGPLWEKNWKTAHSYSTSPHLFADRWDTPILCIHGEKDYRILYSQAVAAFTAARVRGVPAQLLLFPDENHWVLKPQNGILWQRTFFGWLDRWLKP